MEADAGERSVISLGVGNVGDGRLDWYLSSALRHLTWNTVSPKDEVRKSAIETRHKTLACKVLRKFSDGRDEIDDPLSSV